MVPVCDVSGGYSRKWERKVFSIVDADIIPVFLLKVANVSLEMVFVDSCLKIFLNVFKSYLGKEKNLPPVFLKEIYFYCFIPTFP